MLLTTTVSRAGHWQIAEEIFRVCFAGAMDFQGLDNLETSSEGERDGKDRHGVPDALTQSTQKCACLMRDLHLEDEPEIAEQSQVFSRKL
jgi:hypothetical protein